MSFIPAKIIEIICSKGVYLNVGHIEVDGIDTEILDDEWREILLKGPMDIIY